MAALPSATIQTFKDYSLLESLDGGSRIMAQRKKLLDIMPKFKPKVDRLLLQAETELSAAGHTEVEKAVKSLAQACSIADRAKAGASRIGVPPDHPDFPHVVQVEDKLDRYMSEAARLHKLSCSYKNEIQEWRTRVAELSAHRPGLLATFKNAKRENQLFEAVSKPPEASSASSNTGGAATTPRRPSTDPLHQPDKQSSFRSTAPAVSAGVILGSSRTGGGLQLEQAPASARESRSVVPRRPSAGLDDRPGGMCSINAGTILDAEKDQESLDHSLCQTRKKACYLREIRELEIRLKHAKQETCKLKSAQCQGIVRTAELEEFFLLCIDDVRKDFHRHKRCETEKEADSQPTTNAPSEARFTTQNDHHVSAFSSSASCCSSRHSMTHGEMRDKLLASDGLLVCLFEKMFPHRSALSRLKKRVGGICASGGVSAPPDAQAAPTAPLPILSTFEQVAGCSLPVAETANRQPDWRRIQSAAPV